MARGKRRRIAKGIYADASGFAAVVTVGIERREKRFPPDEPLEKIQAWQRETKGTLLIQSTKEPTPHEPRARASFKKAVARYLNQIEGRPGAAADAAHLAAWVERFGDRPRHQITPTDVRLAFAAWRTEGQRRKNQKQARAIAPQTLRHRYRVLKKLYRVLDGPRAATPCDDVPRPAVPRSIPKDVDIATIRKVAVKLRDTDVLAYARFMVLATTGKAPAELMRATAADLDFRRRLWRIHPAKGREPQLLPLNSEMVAALKFFRDVYAWGDYDTSRQAKILRRCGWPDNIRPYNLRHALAIELLRRGRDIGDIQAHLGHASVETTRKFYAGLLKQRERETSKQLEGRLTID